MLRKLGLLNPKKRCMRRNLTVVFKYLKGSYREGRTRFLGGAQQKYKSHTPSFASQSNRRAGNISLQDDCLWEAKEEGKTYVRERSRV
ncbi:hypothetical protein QYF61_000986 [Mycteria americana]|uniref:Uncharacterized protein n=1 Tax=Mycteria americana TaxID=33587 RepID=A0AAN7SHY2_MYCAM|nr:hypothetical protein QYF61_000986 [Mycteria americana]